MESGNSTPTGKTGFKNPMGITWGWGNIELRLRDGSGFFYIGGLQLHPLVLQFAHSNNVQQTSPFGCDFEIAPTQNRKQMELIVLMIIAVIL